MINYIKRSGDWYRVGLILPQISLKICEAIIIPALIYSMEAWSKFKITDIEKIEISQGKFIKWFFKHPKSSPPTGVFLLNVLFSQYKTVQTRRNQYGITRY